MSTEIWLPEKTYYSAINWCYQNDQIIGRIYQIGHPHTPNLIWVKNGMCGLYCENEEDAAMIAMHWLSDKNEI